MRHAGLASSLAHAIVYSSAAWCTLTSVAQTTLYTNVRGLGSSHHALLVSHGRVTFHVDPTGTLPHITPDTAIDAAGAAAMTYVGTVRLVMTRAIVAALSGDRTPPPLEHQFLITLALRDAFAAASIDDDSSDVAIWRAIAVAAATWWSAESPPMASGDVATFALVSVTDAGVWRIQEFVSNGRTIFKLTPGGEQGLALCVCHPNGQHVGSNPFSRAVPGAEGSPAQPREGVFKYVPSPR